MTLKLTIARQIFTSLVPQWLKDASTACKDAEMIVFGGEMSAVLLSSVVDAYPDTPYVVVSYVPTSSTESFAPPGSSGMHGGMDDGFC